MRHPTKTPDDLLSLGTNTSRPLNRKRRAKDSEEDTTSLRYDATGSTLDTTLLAPCTTGI